MSVLDIIMRECEFKAAWDAEQSLFSGGLAADWLVVSPLN